MKNQFYLIMCFLMLLSCKDKIDNHESSSFVFYPRECNFIWANWAKMVDKSSSDRYYFEILGVPENELIAKDALIAISTSNLDTLSLKDENTFYLSYSFVEQQHMQDIDPKFDAKLAPHDKNLEDQLENDYSNPVSKLKSTNAMMTNLVRLEYRITGVKNLTITSSNTLFGKSPGSSLNDFFTIKRLDPKQIISSKTRELLMGYSDRDSVANIAEWLNLEPMAQPSMYLAFKTIPLELPATINFIVTLETSNGKILRDTTRNLTIIP